VGENFDTYGLGNPALNQPVSEAISHYDHSEVIDPLTVKFWFKKPSPGFLQGTSAIGSGPFVASSEKPGRELKLTAREVYNWVPTKFSHQGRAWLDGITILVMPEDSVRIGALLHATNAKEIVDTLFSANYPLATLPLAKTAAGYIDLSQKLTFDPVQSARLLDDAGWEIGPQGVRQKEGKSLILTAYESLP